MDDSLPPRYKNKLVRVEGSAGAKSYAAAEPPTKRFAAITWSFCLPNKAEKVICYDAVNMSLAGWLCARDKIVGIGMDDTTLFVCEQGSSTRITRW